MKKPIIHWSMWSAANSAMTAQQGVSLIMVMLIMVVVSMLGIGGVQIAMMAERGARNDRDMQIAFQAAEAALIDAEFDINNKIAASKRTVNPFDKDNARFLFVADCAGSGNSLGLCAEKAAAEVPDWLKVDFTDATTSAKTVEFGKFTGRAFPVGAAGIQPYQKPRYLIELLNDAGGKEFTPYFRITAMGFGPRQDIQVVLQTVYRN